MAAGETTGCSHGETAEQGAIGTGRGQREGEGIQCRG